MVCFVNGDTAVLKLILCGADKYVAVPTKFPIKFGAVMFPLEVIELADTVPKVVVPDTIIFGILSVPCAVGNFK